MTSKVHPLLRLPYYLELNPTDKIRYLGLYKLDDIRQLLKFFIK